MLSYNFLTSGGLILAADYSQLELRILAHLSCDCRLIQALNCGTDVFKSIAAEWKMIDPETVGDRTRQQAKQVILGKKSIAAFWAGRFSVQHIVVCFSVWIRPSLFSSCFVHPPTLGMLPLEVSGFWGMRVEKSSMNGLDSEDSFWILAFVSIHLSSRESHFVLALLSLLDWPNSSNSLPFPLADLLWNHLWNRSKIFRRADGDWWKWSCQLYWILQIKILRFGYGCLGAGWWWLFLIPSLKFLQILNLSQPTTFISWKCFSFCKCPVHECSSLILCNILLYSLVLFTFKTLFFTNYNNIFVILIN